MLYAEDIRNELVRLYGEHGKDFEILQIGAAYLVGLTFANALEIRGWEDFDLLETL